MNMMSNYEVREIKYDQWDVDHAHRQGTQHGIILGIFYGILGSVVALTAAMGYYHYFM